MRRTVVVSMCAAVLVVLGACRPASYEKDVKVMVPADPPADGPGAAPPGPSTRVHRPADTVKVMVPYNEVLPRGLDTETPGGR